MSRSNISFPTAILLGAAAGPLLASLPAAAQERAARQPADATLAVAAQPAQAVGGFMKFDGVDGSAKDRDHRGWIELSSFSLNGAASAASLRRSQGPGAISFVLPGSTAALAEACAARRVLGTVRIHLPVAEGTGFDEYVLTDARIGTCTQSRSGDRQVESLSLNFGKLEHSSPAGDPDRPLVIGR